MAYSVTQVLIKVLVKKHRKSVLVASKCSLTFLRCSEASPAGHAQSFTYITYFQPGARAREANLWQKLPTQLQIIFHTLRGSFRAYQPFLKKGITNNGVTIVRDPFGHSFDTASRLHHRIYLTKESEYLALLLLCISDMPESESLLGANRQVRKDTYCEYMGWAKTYGVQ